MLSHVLGSLIKTDFLANTEMCRTARSAEREKPRPFKTQFLLLDTPCTRSYQNSPREGSSLVLMTCWWLLFTQTFWWCFFFPIPVSPLCHHLFLNRTSSAVSFSCFSSSPTINPEVNLHMGRALAPPGPVLPPENTTKRPMAPSPQPITTATLQPSRNPSPGVSQ